MIFDGGIGGKTDGFISKHTHVYILLILLLQIEADVCQIACLDLLQKNTTNGL